MTEKARKKLDLLYNHRGPCGIATLMGLYSDWIFTELEGFGDEVQEDEIENDLDEMENI